MSVGNIGRFTFNASYVYIPLIEASGGITAINVNSRTLNDTSGTPVFDWSAGTGYTIDINGSFHTSSTAFLASLLVNESSPYDNSVAFEVN